MARAPAALLAVAAPALTPALGRALQLVLVLTCLLGAAPARAQTASALIEQGVALRERGRDAEAAELFARALEREPTPRARAQLGLAEQALGRWVEAEQHVADALASRRDRWIAARSAVLEEALAEIRSHLGTLEVHANVAGAELRVDGRVVGALPLSEPLRVTAGTIEVRVSAPGWSSVRRRVDVAPGVQTRFGVELQRPDAPAPVPPGGADQDGGGGSGVATVALVVGAVLAAGAVGTGIWWAGRQSEVNVCATSGCLNASELESVRTAAAVTTLATGVLAIASATIGVVLFVSAHHQDAGAPARAAVACGVSPAGAACAFRF